MIKSHDSDSETRCELSAWGGLELCEPIRVAPPPPPFRWGWL